MTSGWRQSLPSLAIALVLLGLMAMQPVPYVRSAPGSTYDALGETDEIELIQIEDSAEHPLYPTSGELRILTVSQWGGPYGQLALGDVLRTLWDPSIVVEPVEFLFPEPVAGEEVENESSAQFTSAKSNAIASALGRLGIPAKTRLRVAFATADGPADGLLLPGDVVTSIAGVRTKEFEALANELALHKPGEEVELGIRRKGQPETVSVKLGENDEGKPIIGIMLVTESFGPMDIRVRLERVGGPSAGLAFALAITDKLTSGELLGGRTVAVTGTIDTQGLVGGIGGLHQKMAAAARAGATWMLFPADNCGDLRADSAPPELTMVPVASLDEAVALLSATSPQLPSCPVG